MGVEVLMTAIAAIGTALAGFITAFVARRADALKQQELRKVDDLAAAIEAQAQAQRAKAVESLAERIPDPSAAAALLRSIEHLSASGRLTLVQPTDSRPDATWSLVEDLVNGYHQQALDQARVQFWFSIAAATVGFSIILFALFTSLGRQDDSMRLLLGTLPGIAINAVAALFFRQAGETRERATALYDRLRTDRQRSEALSLVESIDSVEVRNAVKAELVLHMAGLQESSVGSLLPQLLRVDSMPRIAEPRSSVVEPNKSAAGDVRPDIAG